MEKKRIMIWPFALCPPPAAPQTGSSVNHLTCFCRSALARDFKISDGAKEQISSFQIDGWARNNKIFLKTFKKMATPNISLGNYF